MHDLHVPHPSNHISLAALHVFERLEDVAERRVLKTDMLEDENAEEAVVNYAC